MRDLLERFVEAVEKIATAAQVYAQQRGHQASSHGSKPRRKRTLDQRRDEEIEHMRPTDLDIAKAKRALRGKR